mgnify:CR=1 FL=1
MGYSILLFLVPPICAIPAALLLGITFAALHLSKWTSVLQREDVAHPKGSLVSTGFAVWGISSGAMAAALITTLIVTSFFPFFEGIHSEWGLAYENAYGPAAIYLAIWTLLHAALQFPSIFVLKKRVPGKYGRVYVWYLLFSTVIWAALLFLAYFTLLG